MLDSKMKGLFTSLVIYDGFSTLVLILDIIRRVNGTYVPSAGLAILFPIIIAIFVSNEEERKIRLNDPWLAGSFIIGIILSSFFIIGLIIG